MKFALTYPKSATMGFFSKGLKNEFERAVVNKPSVFESLKVDYMLQHFDVGAGSETSHFCKPVKETNNQSHFFRDACSFETYPKIYLKRYMLAIILMSLPPYFVSI